MSKAYPAVLPEFMDAVPQKSTKSQHGGNMMKHTEMLRPPQATSSGRRLMSQTGREWRKGAMLLAMMRCHWP